MRKILFIWLFCITGICFSQTNITFDPVFGKQKIKTDTYYKLPSGDSLKIETLKFYISNVRLLKNGKPVFTEKQSFHLIDAFRPESLSVKLSEEKIDFDQIAFTIGIDSATNNAGAMDGDLDATKGMYWSWQSGFINFKIEGSSNLYLTRKNEFFFHLGGYLPPNETAQEFAMNVSASNSIVINTDVAKFIAAINFGKQESTMVPGAKAAWLSRQLPLLFSAE